MTLLRRLGNKSKIAKEIQKYFPPHKQYIELFFGAGGMFFNKPKAKYNVVNDNDGDVYNLFNVVINQKEELIDMMTKMPIHADLWEHWKKNKETSDLMKAVRFLFLSNYGYLGKPETLRVGGNNTTQIIIDSINATYDYLFQVYFLNCDFRDVFRKISVKDQERDDYLVYADPPYLGTDNNYATSFTEKDSFDLFDTLENSNLKFAMSEFDHPFILDQAKKRGLKVITVGERVNIKNRRIEILVCNYDTQKTLFD